MRLRSLIMPLVAAVFVAAYAFTARGQATRAAATQPTAGSADEPDVRFVSYQDEVIGREGTRLVGHVIGIDKSVLTLASPLLEGRVRVLLSGVERISFSAHGRTRTGSRIRLVNGDILVGEIASLADGLEVESAYAGKVVAPRGTVCSIETDSTPTLLLESHFDRGNFGTWRSETGGWDFENGRMVCTEQEASVEAPLDQRGMVALEARVEPTGMGLDCTLYVFQTQPANSDGGIFLGARFKDSSWCFVHSQEGSPSFGPEKRFAAPSGLRFPTPSGQFTLRVEYDPSTGQVLASANGETLGRAILPIRPEEGKFVRFDAGRPCKVTSLRVTGRPPLPQAPEGRDMLQFLNGDRIVVENMSIQNGQLRAKSGMGPLTAKCSDIQSIVFGSPDRKKNRIAGSQTVVTTITDHLSVELGSLDNRCLTGVSEILGNLKIQREAVREIVFPESP